LKGAKAPKESVGCHLPLAEANGNISVSGIMPSRSNDSLPFQLPSASADGSDDRNTAFFQSWHQVFSDYSLIELSVNKGNLFLVILLCMATQNKKIAGMTFSSVYPLYLAKVQKKGRTEDELKQVIEWLTGFSKKKLQELIDKEVTFGEFFDQASLNPNARLITGVICGYRVEEIEDPLTRKVRYLDKLVDELAKGRNMEKILRD
jgi:hypothetical protein